MLYILIAAMFAGSGEVDRYLEVLREPDPIVRRDAIKYLGEHGTERVIQPLITQYYRESKQADWTSKHGNQSTKNCQAIVRAVFKIDPNNSRVKRFITRLLNGPGKTKICDDHHIAKPRNWALAAIKEAGKEAEWTVPTVQRLVLLSAQDLAHDCQQVFKQGTKILEQIGGQHESVITMYDNFRIGKGLKRSKQDKLSEIYLERCKVWADYAHKRLTGTLETK